MHVDSWSACRTEPGHGRHRRTHPCRHLSQGIPLVTLRELSSQLASGGGALSEEQLPALRWESLRPYVTVVVLQCLSADPVAAFGELEAYLATPGRRRQGQAVDIVAMSRSTETAEGRAAQYGVDQLGGFVRRTEQTPSWGESAAGFLDVAHDLTVVLRRGDLVAVRADGAVEERLQRRLNKEPRLPFQRLDPVVLENALLQGEAKNLWLRGTHRRSKLRPDVKNLGGGSLEDAVTPWEDSSFVMGSAKAALADDPSRVVLKGVVGTTPRRSSVWFRASADFPDFVMAVLELLELLEQEIATGSAQPRALRVFARRVTDLSAVSGAYDISVMDPELLTGNIADEEFDAADLLADSTLIVHGGPTADFKLEVGLNGSTGGRLATTVSQAGGGYTLTTGHDPLTQPGDPAVVAQVCAALQYPRLLSIYYKSGHAYVDGELWTARIPRDPFPNWEFHDFSGYRLKQEKPDTKSPQEIHEKTGIGGNSLFDWVVQHYPEGWLTCDDGAGEVADFVHVSDSGVLTFIHVKGAGNDSPRRGISAAVYEVVTSQAEKNLLWFSDLDALRDRLDNPPVAKPATWDHGVRLPDRIEFLNAFDSRSASDPLRVVIVQPHVSEMAYNRLRVDPLPTQPSDDLMRLFRLENLLRMTRTSTVGANADLTVISSTT
ncbi:hypothetical protein ACQHIV_24695 [Kribbella sp. GL6]|uniref:hypothetical protein n=1 Tax=Kribbella sp. GL6 TaxID=3419765 RepID=UPI003D088250